MTQTMTRDTDQSLREREIRAVIEDWLAALRAKNAPAAVAHHADGFVQYSLAPPLRSQAAGRAGLEAWFATWQGGLEYEIRDLHIDADRTLAVCHNLSRLSGTKRDGSRADLWFRQTLGFRRIGGKWKITHQHQSVPFYMDGSFRAAVDLRP